MKVYVVEQGCYEDREIVGVYRSLEAAIADNPVPREPKPPTRTTIERPGGWQESVDGRWSNGLDWDEHMTISEMEVIERAEDAE